MTQLTLRRPLWDQAEVHLQLRPHPCQLLLLPHPASLMSHLPRALPQQVTCTGIPVSGSVSRQSNQRQNSPPLEAGSAGETHSTLTALQNRFSFTAGHSHPYTPFNGLLVVNDKIPKWILTTSFFKSSIDGLTLEYAR